METGQFFQSSWRVSSLLSPLNYASFDNEGCFQFSPETEFTSPSHIQSALQQTLKQNHGAWHNCNSVKTMLKLSTFKKLLNELLLETEWSEAMLMWWFVSIKFIALFNSILIMLFIGFLFCLKPFDHTPPKVLNIPNRMPIQSNQI